MRACIFIWLIVVLIPCRALDTSIQPGIWYLSQPRLDTNNSASSEAISFNLHTNIQFQAGLGIGVWLFTGATDFWGRRLAYQNAYAANIFYRTQRGVILYEQGRLDSESKNIQTNTNTDIEIIKFILYLDQSDFLLSSMAARPSTAIYDRIGDVEISYQPYASDDSGVQFLFGAGKIEGNQKFHLGARYQLKNEWQMGIRLDFLRNINDSLSIEFKYIYNRKKNIKQIMRTQAIAHFHSIYLGR